LIERGENLRKIIILEINRRKLIPIIPSETLYIKRNRKNFRDYLKTNYKLGFFFVTSIGTLSFKKHLNNIWFCS